MPFPPANIRIDLAVRFFVFRNRPESPRVFEGVWAQLARRNDGQGFWRDTRRKPQQLKTRSLAGGLGFTGCLAFLSQSIQTHTDHRREAPDRSCSCPSHPLFALIARLPCVSPLVLGACLPWALRLPCALRLPWASSLALGVPLALCAPLALDTPLALGVPACLLPPLSWRSACPGRPLALGAPFEGMTVCKHAFQFTFARGFQWD